VKQAGLQAASKFYIRKNLNKITFTLAKKPFHQIRSAMPTPTGNISRLFSTRNTFGKQTAADKIELLETINPGIKTSIKQIQLYYECLLFIIAYPDNKTIYTLAIHALQQLELIILANEKIKEKLYNSGITHTNLCAAFSFEMVKWLRQADARQITLSSFEATDEQIKFILSAVMPKLESEILQDANAEWKGWLQQFTRNGKELLDHLIAIFESAPLRPEIKDELWIAMGVNVEINVGPHACLRPGLFKTYYHRSLQRKPAPNLESAATRVPLNTSEAAEIIEVSRKILVRHLREIDPISFTAPRLVNYYQLPRGISIALMQMPPARRHPLDSYMGYMVFKNGLPVAYAGSWIMFDSARIGLNVFPAYRGGESQYIFQQVLLLHQDVYKLKRFTADPYQLGKHNSDGIKSGAFWVYYRAGFRPLQKEQQDLAEAEAGKIKANARYRTPARILKKLADCRLQLILDDSAVYFDATDLSRAWAGILANKYNNDRLAPPANAARKLAGILKIKMDGDANLDFVLYNWSGLLLWNEPALRRDKPLQQVLKRLCLLKARGNEEGYIRELQRAKGLRIYLQKILYSFVSS
jgi:hypothetical protein